MGIQCLWTWGICTCGKYSFECGSCPLGEVNACRHRASVHGHGASVHVVSTALSVVPAPRGESRPVDTGASVHVVIRALSVVPAPWGKSMPVDMGHLYMW